MAGKLVMTFNGPGDGNVGHPDTDLFVGWISGHRERLVDLLETPTAPSTYKTPAAIERYVDKVLQKNLMSCLNIPCAAKLLCVSVLAKDGAEVFSAEENAGCNVLQWFKKNYPRWVDSLRYMDSIQLDDLEVRVFGFNIVDFFRIACCDALLAKQYELVPTQLWARGIDHSLTGLYDPLALLLDAAERKLVTYEVLGGLMGHTHKPAMMRIDIARSLANSCLQLTQSLGLLA